MTLAAFGSLGLGCVLIAAAYTFGVAVVAGRGRPGLLPAARAGTYATCALVATLVMLLAYAFVTHDFSIRYVARYSDRSMPIWYLVTSLWGGQDGSLLWWSFILSMYTLAVTRWLRGRHTELQPYVLATLMSIVMFFCVLMLFTANPFAVSYGNIPADGEGLNPLLQNYWMTIHPPTLYSGLIGWSVPFSFVIAALVTGRLGEEWIYASRRWMLIAWLFLSVGNLLGALWSYEELGWGGYWAWDPVENASFMPWLVGTAFLHSVMIQERRGMLKVWNVFLLCLTFILTIFGTFLTRSGLIASVHSFARSDIGIYFVYYLVFLVVACFSLIVWRLSKLKAQAEIDSLLSREFAFLLNNWVLLGMMFFILLATTFPLLSEAIRGETVTVGASYYNKWMVPLGLILLFLTGAGPLMAWRKATGKNLARAFMWPAVVGLSAGLVHLAFGARIGFPAFISSDKLYETLTGAVLAKIYAVMPLLSIVLSAFVLGAIAQEFIRGAALRRKNAGESWPVALVQLTLKARRRYGGYIVHVAIVAMYLGFTGAAYDTEREFTLEPGQTYRVLDVNLRYRGPRMETDPNKRMVFADVEAQTGYGAPVVLSPAKFIYRTHPEMPTTEVAIRSSLLRDLYLIMSRVDPQTKVATFRIIVRPLVVWIWLGGLLLIFGTLLAMAPSLRELLGRDEASSRRSSLAPTAALLPLVFAAVSGLAWPAAAHADDPGSSSLHAGSVTMNNDTERHLFGRLLCMCGDCQRLPLSTCGCGWAEEARAEIRDELHAGKPPDAIIADYRVKHGAKAIAVPSDRGLDRALWLIPIAAFAVAALGLVALGRSWVKRRSRTVTAQQASAPSAVASAAPGTTAASGAIPAKSYDRALDAELNRLDDE